VKITDLLKPEGIRVGVEAADRMDAIDKLIELQDASGNISDKEAYKAGILAREEEFPTAVGEGIAIPHAKVAAVVKPGLAAMTVPGGVDWDAPDGEPSDLMFMIAAPEGENNTHLEMLAKLSQLLMHKEFADKLRAATTPAEFLAAIDEAEAERDAAEDTSKPEAPKAKSQNSSKVKAAKIPEAIVQLISESVSDLCGVANDNSGVFMGELGNLILKKQPDFDCRNFGYRSLSALIKSLDMFEIEFRQTTDPNIKHPYVRERE